MNMSWVSHIGDDEMTLLRCFHSIQDMWLDGEIFVCNIKLHYCCHCYRDDYAAGAI